MIVKVGDKNFIQKCVCEQLIEHFYSDLKINNIHDIACIELPACNLCGAKEFLFHNNSDDDHGVKITKIFANVAIQGK